MSRMVIYYTIEPTSGNGPLFSNDELIITKKVPLVTGELFYFIHGIRLFT